MGRPRKYTDKEIIAALKKKRGMVYLAAAKIGCEADTIYNRAKSSSAVASVMRHERGKVVDLAEDKLFCAIQKGEPWAIQMALRCLAKDRGYIERVEQTGANGAPLGQSNQNVNVAVVNTMPDRAAIIGYLRDIGLADGSLHQDGDEQSLDRGDGLHAAPEATAILDAHRDS